MARTYASVKLSIWGDDDWRDLSVDAQHLYLTLLTSARLTHCGVADWRPARIARLACDWKSERVEMAGYELEDQLYLVIDRETEEALIRSYLRNDELMKQPKMAVAVASAHDEIASKVLRGVVVHEMQRLRVDFPELKGWEVDKALELLCRPDIDPGTYPLADPTIRGWVQGYLKGSVGGPERGAERVFLGLGGGSENGSEKGCPTPVPTPAPTTEHLKPVVGVASEPNGGAPQQAASPTTSSRGHRLPEGWVPSEDARTAMREELCGLPDEWWRLEFAKFSDHWPAQPGQKGLKTNWERTWKNWVRNADKPRGYGATHAAQQVVGQKGWGRKVDRSAG